MTAEHTPPERPSQRPGKKNGTTRDSAESHDAKPWPELAAEDQWTIELMEELLDSTEQAPDELHARAAKLRKAARESDAGQRDAALALADRYDQAAGSWRAHR